MRQHKPILSLARERESISPAVSQPSRWALCVSRTLMHIGLFCDGTHKNTQGEEPSKLYWYDEGVKRHIATDHYASIRDDKLTKDA